MSYLPSWECPVSFQYKKKTRKLDIKFSGLQAYIVRPSTEEVETDKYLNLRLACAIQ